MDTPPTTNAHAADLARSPYREHTEGEKLICWRVRKDDKVGQPIPFHTCLWCGSMTPQQFVELLKKPDTKCDVADWKYGYPHKVYVEFPNPNPDEDRFCGSTSEGSKLQYHPDGSTYHVKTQEAGPSGFPVWHDRCGWSSLSKYPTLHLKFYTAHLEDLSEAELIENADLFFRKTGIYFFRRDGKLMYSGRRPGGHV